MPSQKSLQAALTGIGAAMAAVTTSLPARLTTSSLQAVRRAIMPKPKRPWASVSSTNAAIAARHAQKVHGAERVAIVDWDVHHGNGTQDIFWNDTSVLFCSTHQMPLYPWSGEKNETGVKNNVRQRTAIPQHRKRPFP